MIGNQRQLEMRDSADSWRTSKSFRSMCASPDAGRPGRRQTLPRPRIQQRRRGVRSQLVTAEQASEDLKTLHDQALSAAAQAKKASNNAMVLQQKIARANKLLSQLEQAKMQERSAQPLRSW